MQKIVYEIDRKKNSFIVVNKLELVKFEKLYFNSIFNSIGKGVFSVQSSFFLNCSYLMDFYLRYLILFRLNKIQSSFRYKRDQSRRVQQVPYGRCKPKRQKKTILLKIYLLVQFLSNLLQNFAFYLLLIFKSFECRNSFYFQKKFLFFKGNSFF